ncbi:855_t:CDS:2 [Paraglomus brasilianum]|uniref:855_t:CDS:1 n=1 Tax=Paraglomus brasilianum TaxID=144538 RepID=A0A9N9F0U5_9GLOM|nr:855_t:CDS:2 [Paraglomus brasilianum]
MSMPLPVDESIAPQDRHRGHCHMWCLPYGNGPIGITNDVIPKTDKSIDDAN